MPGPWRWPGSGGFGFLVLGLAVNDAGDAFLGVLPHPFPDAHHVAASGIHQFAAFGDQLLLRLHFRAERRDDDNIPRVQPGNSSSVGLGEMIWMPMLRIWSLTSGLWMISPSR
jgi:hypothetical protein